MVAFEKRVLDNGMRVIVHEDHSTPMAAVNLLYDVGSRDEDPARTGFAHLFEHLMFGGTKNIPDFDGPIQLAGGENNAFTNADMTNFYNILPAQNIETALWLESDRMNGLDFSQRALDIQKKVVVEEFNEVCLGVPYGDLWHHLCALCYKKHPYRWPTIGLIPDHIREARLEDVEAFFYRFYRPSNAILVIAGNLEKEKAFDLAEAWFGEIECGDFHHRKLPREVPQKEYRKQVVEAPVPMSSINLAFHMPGRLDPDYYAYDLLSDVLSNGPSSRLYRRMVKEESIFTDIDAFITGSIDPGLLIVTGKPMEGMDLQYAIDRVMKELEDLSNEQVPDKELIKLKNKVESNLVFSEVNILNKAMSLAYFELIGDAGEINREADQYNRVTPMDVQKAASAIFRKENCSELTYIPSAI
jgi:zinc protease